MSAPEPSIALALAEKTRVNRKRLREENNAAEQKTVQEFLAKLLPLADNAALFGYSDCSVPFERKHENAIRTAVLKAGFIKVVYDEDDYYASGFRVSWPVFPDDE